MELPDLIRDFCSIIYEALPFIILGVVIAGILEEFVPQQAISKVVPRNPYLSIGLGALLGLVFPMCECGIIVVMRRLLRKGLPLSVCVAYMLAGPIINVVVILSTYIAFDPGDPKFYILGGPLYVVLWRVGLAFLIAVVTASMVEALWRKHGLALLHPKVAAGLPAPISSRPAPLPQEPHATGLPLVEGPEPEPVKRSWRDSLNNMSATALNDFVEIMTFLVIGAAIAMVGRKAVTEFGLQNTLQEAPALSILIMMGLAVIFCLCSEADAFVAANFDTSVVGNVAPSAAAGAAQFFLPPASKMAFLVLGPMLDIKLYLMYTRIFRPRLIFTIIFFVACQVFLYTLAMHYLYEWLGTPPLAPSSP